jgi:hypothetical protein
MIYDIFFMNINSLFDLNFENHTNFTIDNEFSHGYCVQPHIE